MSRAGSVDLYPALQRCVDAHEVVPEVEWNPWDDSGGTIRTNSGFTRWGVDRLSILLPWDGRFVRKTALREGWTVHVSTPKKGRLRVDFNPAQERTRALHPCPVGDLAEVVRIVVDRVGRVFPVGHFTAARLGEVQLTRVDLARDFEGVEHRPAILEGVHRLPRRQRLKVEAYRNERVMTRPNGVVLGTDEGATLYDRHLLYRSLDDDRLKDGVQSAIPKGVVRFEAKARSGWLKKAGIAVLSDLTAASCLDLLRDRWVWSQFGTPVADRSGYIVAIQNAGWSRHDQQAHYWIESCSEVGRPVELDSRQKRRHKERLRQLGPFVELGDIAQVRLDLNLGTEICSAGATS